MTERQHLQKMVTNLPHVPLQYHTFVNTNVTTPFGAVASVVAKVHFGFNVLNFPVCTKCLTWVLIFHISYYIPGLIVTLYLLMHVKSSVCIPASFFCMVILVNLKFALVRACDHESGK